MKRCPNCKKLLENSDFYRNSQKPDGLSSRCKLCTYVPKRKHKTPLDIYNAYVVKSLEKEKCWGWTGSDRGGYGAFRHNGITYSAHRFAYEHFIGPIPDGHYVLHKCDNPSCSNPEHLFTSTQKGNSEDMIFTSTQKGNAEDKIVKDHQPNYDKDITTKLEQAKCDKNITTKLEPEDVITMRNKYAAQTHSMRDLAQEYNLNVKTVWKIVHRKTWKHI